MSDFYSQRSQAYGLGSNNTKSTKSVNDFYSQRKNAYSGGVVRKPQQQPISGSLIDSSQVDEKKGGFISKTKKVLGIGTGEWKQLGSNVKEKSQGFLQDIGYRDQQGTLKDDAKNWVKDVYNNTKDKIVEAVKKKEANKQAYFGDMTDITKLNYEQIRDYESNHFLKLVEEDLRQDLNRLQDKKDKSWGDNYRIKNYSKTLEKIDEAKNIPADQKYRFDSFINGLAIARGSSAITAGLLNIGESFFDFVKWRGDVAEAEELSEFSEKAGDRVNIWAEEVRPNNPQFADSLLEGMGSTIPFYVTGLGISSVAGRISTVSPAIAKAIGIGSSAFMEAGLEAGSTYQTLIDMGYEKEEADLRASRVFVGNAIYNYFTDKYGLFNDEVGVKKVIQAGLGEGFQETWQNGLQNIATDGNFWENAGETFLMSFITGAFLTNFGDPVVQDQTINDQDLAKLQKIQEEIKKEVGKQQEIDTKQATHSQTNVTIENLSSVATNSLENKNVGVKPGAIENAKQEIQEGITPPIKIRTIEDGSIVIEDGRHHLEALRQLGIENYKNYPIEDVTKFYEPKRAEVEQGEVSEPKIKEAVEEDLTKEAQKYKSAEEFVNKGTETLYRVAPNFPKDNWEAGTYFATSPETARYYAESHYKGDPSDLKVIEVKLPSSLIYERTAGGANVRLRDSFPVSEKEVNSQLTDIWNKANKKEKSPEKKPKTVFKKESVKTETQILPKNESIYEESKKVGAKRLSPDRILHHQMTAQESITKIKNSIEKDIDLLEKNRPVRASQKVIREFNEIELKIKNNQATEAEQKWFNRVKDQINVAKAYLELKDFIGADKNIFKAELLQKAREKLASENGVKNYYIKLVKKDISKGYKFPPEVLSFDRSFTVAVNNRARYEKGLRTSFSADDERIVFDDKNRIVGGLKRQDGNQITQAQIEEIVNGVLQTQEALGIDMNKIARDERWIYAHLNGKNPFLTANAGGMYRKTEDGNISISVGGTEGFWTKIDGKRVRKKVNTTVAHELGHALDHHTGQKIFSGEDIFELRKTYKPIEYTPRSSKYWGSSSEIKARAIEQYVAIENGHESYFEREAYWNEEVYNKTIKPMVESAMDKHFSEYQGKLIKPESVKQGVQEETKTEEKEAEPKIKERETKPKVQDSSKTKASKVAVSIEQNLNERFETLAGFETRNVKSQAKLVSKLIAKDIDKVRDIVTGKAPLPAGMSGSMFIAGVEQYASENNDIDLLRSLATSPLVSETSVHAQELRFLAERDKTSVLSKIQEVANERAKIFKRRHSEKLEKVVKKETAKIKESVKVSKYDWNTFIKSIEC